MYRDGSLDENEVYIHTYDAVLCSFVRANFRSVLIMSVNLISIETLATSVTIRLSYLARRKKKKISGNPKQIRYGGYAEVRRVSNEKQLINIAQ